MFDLSWSHTGFVVDLVSLPDLALDSMLEWLVEARKKEAENRDRPSS